MKKIIYSLILLSLLFGAISVLAQDGNLPSPGILPDSPFYFLKVWKEAIQNFFTFGAENKAKQFLHLADVRLAEYQKMIEKGKTEIAQKTLDKYQRQLDHALQKIEELKNKGEDTTNISQKAEDTINKHIEVLQRNLEKAPDAAKKGLQNAIENSSKVLEKAGGKTKKEQSCLDSGGTITTASCCQSVNDFPDICLIGACGCSPENSHEVKTCDCGDDKCFDGEKCVFQEMARDETADVGKIVDEFMKARMARDGALALSYLNENAISGLGGRAEAQLYLIGPSNPHLYKYEITLISEFPKGTPNYPEGGYKAIVKGYEEYTGEGETGSFIEGLNLIQAQGKWVVNEVIHRIYQ